MPPTRTDEGLRAAQAIRARWPHTGILILTEHLPPSYALELLSGGTRGIGCLLMERISDLNELSAAIERIRQGGSVLDAIVLERLLGRAGRGDDLLEQLTQREHQVLALVAEGRSNKGIAERPYVTEHTVEKHVKSILGTLGLPPRRPPPRARRARLPQRALAISALQPA